MKNFFPARVLLEPASTFASIGKTGWAWPLGLYFLALAGAALQLFLLPPRFIEAALEGAALKPSSVFSFYFLFSLPAGLLFSALTCAILALLAGFLREGRLSLRLPAAAAAVGACGIMAAAARGPGTAYTAGLASLLALSAAAAWGGWRHRRVYPDLFKALLAISALSLAGDIFSGLAALSGSVQLYSGLQYLFALIALVWLGKAVSAVCGVPGPRAITACILAMLASAALLFSLFNIGLLPQEVFQVLLLV